MAQTILDGTGDEYSARVDTTNRLHTRSVSNTLAREESLNGNHYAIGTPLITLTSDSDSAILYVENTGERDLFVDRFIMNARAAASATEDFLALNIFVNPTGMTGGSGADLINTNVNFGSPKVATISSEYGAEGATLDDGIASGAFIYKTELSTFTDIRIVLPKGARLGLTVTPPAGTTSLPLTTFIELTEIQTN